MDFHSLVCLKTWGYGSKHGKTQGYRRLSFGDFIVKSLSLTFCLFTSLCFRFSFRRSSVFRTDPWMVRGYVLIYSNNRRKKLPRPHYTAAAEIKRLLTKSASGSSNLKLYFRSNSSCFSTSDSSYSKNNRAKVCKSCLSLETIIENQKWNEGRTMNSILHKTRRQALISFFTCSFVLDLSSLVTLEELGNEFNQVRTNAVKRLIQTKSIYNVIF